MLTKPTTKPIAVHVMTVTPDMAAAWLEANVANRAINRKSVERFKADMKADAWHLTGDMIRFDKNGALIDGQHRLTACIEANVPFRTYVGYNFLDEIKSVVDTGRSRTNADIITMAGVQNGNIVAAALRILINERRGTSLDGGTKATSNKEVLDALSRHPNLPNYAIVSRSMPAGISCSTVTYLNYVGSELIGRPEAAARMVEVLRTGIPSYEHDVMHMLRERLAMGKHRGLAISYAHQLWFFKKAWNLFAEERTMRHLTAPTSNVDLDGLDLELL